jgi:hypothetical protein
VEHLLAAASQVTLIVMEKQRLSQTLEQLRAELSQAERVDPETLAELRRLTDDIQRKLADREELTSDEVEPASSGLKDQLLKFEAEHPQLAAAIGRVADALAAMGI